MAGEENLVPDTAQEPVTGNNFSLYTQDGSVMMGSDSGAGTTATATFGGTGETWEHVSFDINMDTEHMKFRFRKGKGKVNVELVFKLVKKKLSMIEHRRLKARMISLEKLADEYSQLGQVELSEETMVKWEKAVLETELYAKGFTMFLEKEHLEKFCELADDNDNLFMTDLKEYRRQLPPDVQKKIKEAKVMKVFDAFFILHYDPNLKAVGKAKKKEVERKRKDPVLFGVFKQSSRFYFIADWEDEFCDLSFEDIVDKIQPDLSGIVLTRKLTADEFEARHPEEVKPIKKKKIKRKPKK